MPVGHDPMIIYSSGELMNFLAMIHFADLFLSVKFVMNQSLTEEE